MSSVNRQTLLAAVLIAGFAGTVFGGVGGCLVGHQMGKGGGMAAPSSSKVYTRDEFRQAVLGKTPDEVLKLLGKPDRTDEDGPQWIYYDRRRDPLTGKIDELTFVRFSGGRVADVR